MIMTHSLTIKSNLWSFRPQFTSCRIAISAFALCLPLLMSCQNKQTSVIPAQATVADSVSAAAPEPAAAADESYMKAPEVKADANGLIALADCPTTNEHLSVSVNDDHTEAVISYDGKTLQTVEDEDALVAAGGDVAIHYLDANFDGFIDIFLGPGESRTYSTLLLWNAESEQFIRIGTLGEPTLQGFMLEPATKSVIEGGSGSASSFYITRSLWDGQKLEQKEQLVVITMPSEYEANNVSAAFTLRDANEKEIASTSESKTLPGSWPGIVAKYQLE